MAKLLCIFFTVMGYCCATAIVDDSPELQQAMREMIEYTKQLELTLKNVNHIKDICTPAIMESNCTLICFKVGLKTLQRNCKKNPTIPNCKRHVGIILSNMKSFQNEGTCQRCEFTKKKVPEFLKELEMFLQGIYKTPQKQM